jgi:hypothetical protein
MDGQVLRGSGARGGDAPIRGGGRREGAIDEATMPLPLASADPYRGASPASGVSPDTIRAEDTESGGEIGAPVAGGSLHHQNSERGIETVDTTSSPATAAPRWTRGWMPGWRWTWTGRPGPMGWGSTWAPTSSGRRGGSICRSCGGGPREGGDGGRARAHAVRPYGGDRGTATSGPGAALRLAGKGGILPLLLRTTRGPGHEQDDIVARQGVAAWRVLVGLAKSGPARCRRGSGNDSDLRSGGSEEQGT